MSIFSLRVLSCVLALSCFSFVSLAVTPPTDAVQAAAAEAPPWAGDYRGVLPAASCPGIKMLLTLHEDDSFRKEIVYMETESLPYVTEGTVEWKEEGKIFVIHDPYRDELYECGKECIYVLDSDGKRVTGEMAPYYILQKRSTEDQQGVGACA